MAYANPATFSQLNAAAGNLRAELWNQDFMYHGDTEDILSKLEGPEGGNAPVTTKRQLAAAQGDRIHFGGLEELGELGQIGEDAVEGAEETPVYTHVVVVADFKRHSTGYTKKQAKVLAQGKSLKQAFVGLLGRHFGLRKQDEALLTLIRDANEDNTYYAGDKSGVENLKSADVFSQDTIVKASERNQVLGSKPCGVYKRTKGGYEVVDQHNWIYLADISQLTPLQVVNDYVKQVVQAAQRGGMNQVFTGGFEDWQGNRIVPFRGVEGAKIGPIGSPLKPTAFLGDPLADADGQTPDLTGGGRATPSTVPKFFKDFAGYDYPYFDGQTALNDTATRYALILNIKGTDAGKVGFVSYVGNANAGNKIVLTGRITAAVTSLGNVDSTASPWTGNTTSDHDTGSIIIPCNSFGVPFITSLSLGANSLCRAYGVDYNVSMELRDHGFRYSIAYEAMFGQSVSTDALNRPENYVAVISARNYTGFDLPVVA